MNSRVKTLAELVCPRCGGTTKLVIPNPDDPWDENNLVGCDACLGSGALVAGLRRECPSRWEGRVHREHCEGCQRGWTLIPAAKQMGVLVRGKRCLTLWVLDNGGWCANIDYGMGAGKEDTPEEALAGAILQSLGVSTP